MPASASSAARRGASPNRPSEARTALSLCQTACPSSPAVKRPPSEATHVRSGSDGGAGIKPSDRYSVSLCTSCHELQHRFGELTFWSVLRIDPLNVALRLWTVSGDLEAGDRVVFRARQQINLMKIDPQRTKFPSHSNRVTPDEKDRR